MRKVPIPSTFDEADAIIDEYGKPTGPDILTVKCDRPNTFLFRSEAGPDVTLYLYRTPIVSFHPTGNVTLRSGGHTTTLTKERINRVLEPLGYRLFARNRIWHISTPRGHTRIFDENMTIRPRLGI